MQTLRCKKCNKVLMEAEGQAHISKTCPKCKTDNDFYIFNLTDKQTKEFKDKWENMMKYNHSESKIKIIKK